MYYMDEELPPPIKREINFDTPYRFDYNDGVTYSILFRLLEEGDRYHAETDSFRYSLRAVGETIPECEMRVGDVIRVYHVDSPGTGWVDLKFAVSHDGVYSSGQFFGEGSIIMLGPLRDTLEPEEDND